MSTPQNTSESITMTDAALKHVRAQLQKRNTSKGVRFGVKKVGCSGFAYVVNFLEEDPTAEDQEFKVAEGVSIFVDKKYISMLQGTRLDYIKQGLNSGFEFHNPNSTGSCGCGESFSIE